MPWRPIPQARVRGQVYVLHFDRPVGPPHQRAGHYIGWSLRADDRIRQHRNGHGGRLPAVLHAAGGSFVVAQVFDGATRADERRLKNRGGASRVCAVCRGRPMVLRDRAEGPS